MYIGLFILLLVMSLAVHELGHGLAMLKYGVPIQSAGIGFRIPGLSWLCLRWRWREIDICIAPIMLGAYVEATTKGEAMLENLELRQRLTVYGAGIIGNIFFAGALLVLLAFGTVVLNHNIMGPLICVGTSLIICALVWFGRNIFNKYVIPIMGMLLFAVVISGFFQEPEVITREVVNEYGETVLITERAAPNISGSIGIVSMAAHDVDSPALLLLFAAFISISIGLFNMLPVFPLDGGRTALALLQQKIKTQWILNTFMFSGVAMIWSLFIYVMISDYINYIK